MGAATAATGCIVLEDTEGTVMVIFCVDLRYGSKKGGWLIVIPCTYHINFEPTFPCHFLSMEVCNSHFIW